MHRLVRAETPQARGVHAVSMRRSVGYVPEGGRQTWADAMNDVVLALMIEKKGAMENLQEVRSVEGVDVAQFGHTDCSISIGLPGQGWSEPVQRAHLRMIETALEMDVRRRVEIGDFEQAKPYLDAGIRHFSIGWDIVAIYRWSRHEAAAICGPPDSL